MGPAEGSCASSANTRRSSSASFPQAAFKKASRRSGVSSLAEWYSSSICRSRSGPILATCVTQSYSDRSLGRGQMGTPIQSALDQTDVFLREVEVPAVHLEVVAGVPVRLHDA